MEKFHALMTQKFGFAKTGDDLIVEFFEDSFEDTQGAVRDLMRVLKDVHARVGHRASNTFVCFTGRFYTMDAKFDPAPEDCEIQDCSIGLGWNK